jgi:hypothetical protein
MMAFLAAVMWAFKKRNWKIFVFYPEFLEASIGRKCCKRHHLRLIN